MSATTSEGEADGQTDAGNPEGATQSNGEASGKPSAGDMDTWATDASEVLAQQVPKDPEIVESLLASRPEIVVEVWEERAERILTLEQGFLDEPDFNKAGELYDLLDQMEAWLPQSDMMEPILQDGVAVADMRDMLDKWSFAVQSATKASLAKVAGEAALALRREKLAIRELWETSDLNLTPLKVRWSDWRDANRGMPETRPEDAVMQVEEGNALIERWEAVLEDSDQAWDRKERSGWRGDWLDRQQVELELNREFWNNELESMESLAMATANDAAVSDSAPLGLEADGSEVGVSQGESPDGGTAASTAEESKVQETFIDVVGSTEVALVAQLLPPLSGAPQTDETRGVLAQDGADWSGQWDSAVAASKDVARQWERLSRASDGQGVAPVSDGAELMELPPAVRSAYSGLVASVIDELVALRKDWERERAPLLAQWEEREFAGMGNSDAVVRARELWATAQRKEGEAEDLERSRKSGDAAAFDRALTQRQVLAQAEVAWRDWASAWEEVLESEAAPEELAAVEQVAKDDALLTEAEGENVPQGPESVISAPVEVSSSNPAASGGTVGVPNSAALDAAHEVDVPEPAEAEGSKAADGVASDIEEEPMDSPSASEVGPEMTDSEPAVEEIKSGSADGQAAAESVDLTEVLENSSAERQQRMASLMTALDAMQRSELPLNLESTEREALAAWLERIDIVGNAPGTAAGRAARMAWDKRMFFNERRLRAALNALDVELLERKLSGEFQEEELAEAEVSLSEFEETRVGGGDLNSIIEGESGAAPVDLPGAVVSAEVAEAAAAASDIDLADTVDEAALVRTVPETEAVARQNADVASYGLVLPTAEVWGSSSNSGRSGGLTLRPIDRVELERSILAQPFAAESEEAASERFGSERGAPLAEGVEYKIQIGAFRKALPAALFAAFDPMWAQKLSNGITRYMAGSFDLYDPAVAARDAIRALGYEDAFVVRFVDGERVRASRPEPELLAEERASVAGRDVLTPRPVGAAVGAINASPEGRPMASAPISGVGESPLPTRREDIPTWDGIAGRVYSVQVGAFRGVPDAEAMASLGTLTREDAGSDGWLRLFSGRFATQTEAEVHRSELRGQGRTDAFIVVYINGRRIPLSQASLTSVASLPGAAASEETQTEPAVVQPEAVVPVSPVAEVAEAWCVELGVFNSTIPVRLANAILDAPLQWQIRSVRSDGLTRYRTAYVTEEQAQNWLSAAQVAGFSNAQVVRE